MVRRLIAEKRSTFTLQRSSFNVQPIMRRRDFLKTASRSAAGLALVGGTAATAAGCAGSSSAAASGSAGADPLYEISLAEYSLHRAIGNGEMSNLEFPQVAREEFGIDAVEYVNFFFDSTEQSYLRRLETRADDAGVNNLLIMCSREGHLAAPTEAKRQEAIDNHKKWIEAAAYLGCHSIRVDAVGSGSAAEQERRMAESLRRLCAFSEENGGLNILVENHSQQAADAAWLASVIERTDHPLAGTLPDFGNFCLEWEGEEWTSDCVREYDYYQGIRELMPYADAVSAKSYDFGSDGNETTIDYERMMQIVLNHDYHGHVGIEYEGDEMGEYEGIRATKRLLKRVRRTLRDA
jgi:sugar phosphate isomerase/epimerase